MRLTTNELNIAKKAKSFLLCNGCLFGKDKNGVFFFIRQLNNIEKNVCVEFSISKSCYAVYDFDSICNIKENTLTINGKEISCYKHDFHLRFIENEKAFDALVLTDIEKMYLCSLFSYKKNERNRDCLKCVYIAQNTLVATDARRLIYTTVENNLKEFDSVLLDVDLLPYAQDGDILHYNISQGNGGEMIKDKDGNIKAFSLYCETHFPNWKGVLFGSEKLTSFDIDVKALDTAIKASVKKEDIYFDSTCYQIIDGIKNELPFVFACPQCLRFDYDYLTDLVKVAKKAKVKTITLSFVPKDTTKAIKTEWKIGDYTALVMTECTD